MLPSLVICLDDICIYSSTSQAPQKNKHVIHKNKSYVVITPTIYCYRYRYFFVNLLYESLISDASVLRCGLVKKTYRQIESKDREICDSTFLTILRMRSRIGHLCPIEIKTNTSNFWNNNNVWIDFMWNHFEIMEYFFFFH